MKENKQSPQENNRGLEMFLLFLGMVIVWPAFVLGAIARLLIKHHTTEQYPYWIGAGMLGALGTVFLCTRANPYPFVLTLSQDIVPLAVHVSGTTLMNFVHDAFPLWTRSVLVFPLCTLALELFGIKSLETTLLAKEQQRRVIQVKKSQHAARKVRKAPDHINGKAVLGALIDNPNV